MRENEFIIYQTENGLTKVEARLIDEMLWMPQVQMAELFDVQKSAISKHLKKIYETGELNRTATVSKLETVQEEGGRSVKRSIEFYNLDAIIAVGYRINSLRATQFRIWATQILKEYLIKGFAMNDERLKQSDNWDYFDEWLARIRDIRASEKRFYQKIRDLYATAIDYNKDSQEAQSFFANVQNQMLWAVTGKTAAEIIAMRSNPKTENMGLNSWIGSIARKEDVTSSKNYLTKPEIEELNWIVTMYLDFAEDQAKQRKVMTMQQWSDKLVSFLEFNGREILTHLGTISHDLAVQLATDRYRIFDKNRKRQQALEADKEDFKALEALVKCSAKLK